MAQLLEKSKYIIFIPVIAFMAASLATFLWGAVKVADVVVLLVTIPESNSEAIVTVLEMMDTFLIGTVLFIFSIGFYDLFIGHVETPEWLNIDDLGKLKTKLSDVIVLFMSIKFLDKLLQSKDAFETLLYAIGIAIISAVLIALNRSRNEH